MNDLNEYKLPIIGHLPIKTQYIISTLAIVLSTSLFILLLVLSLSGNSELKNMENQYFNLMQNPQNIQQTAQTNFQEVKEIKNDKYVEAYVNVAKGIEVNKNLYNIQQEVINARETDTINVFYLFLAVSMLILSGFFIYVLFNVSKFQMELISEKDRQAKFNHETDIMKLIGEILSMQQNDLSMLLTVNESMTGQVADELNVIFKDLNILFTELKLKNNELLIKANYNTERMAEANVNSLNISKTLRDSVGLLDNFKETTDKLREISNASSFNRVVLEDDFGVHEKTLNRFMNNFKSLGEMIELLKNISEDTSVLASNAAIQSSQNDNVRRIIDRITELSNQSDELTKKFAISIDKMSNDANDIEHQMQQIKSKIQLDKQEKEKSKNIRGMSALVSEYTSTSNDLLAKLNELIELDKANNLSETHISKNFEKMVELVKEINEKVSKYKTS